MKRIVLIILAIMLIFISGCEKLFTTNVKYEVNCTTPGFKVYYTNSEGDEGINKIQGYLWSKEVLIDKIVKEVCLSAFMDSISLYDTITGKIYIENKLKLEYSGSVIFNKCVEL